MDRAHQFYVEFRASLGFFHRENACLCQTPRARSQRGLHAQLFLLREQLLAQQLKLLRAGFAGLCSGVVAQPCLPIALFAVELSQLRSSVVAVLGTPLCMTLAGCGSLGVKSSGLAGNIDVGGCCVTLGALRIAQATLGVFQCRLFLRRGQCAVAFNLDAGHGVAVQPRFLRKECLVFFAGEVLLARPLACIKR